jgi:hypothetical protein
MTISIECRYAECRDYVNVKLCVIMLHVITQNVVMLHVIMRNVVMLHVIMLNVVKLSVVATKTMFNKCVGEFMSFPRLNFVESIKNL